MTKSEASDKMHAFAKEYFEKHKKICSTNHEAMEVLHNNREKLSVIGTMIGRGQRSAAMAGIVALDKVIRLEIPMGILRYVHYIT